MFSLISLAFIFSVTLSNGDSWSDCYGACNSTFATAATSLTPTTPGAYLTTLCSNYGWEIDDLEPVFSDGSTDEFGGHGGGFKCTPAVNEGHCFTSVTFKSDSLGIEALELTTSDGIVTNFYSSGNPSTSPWTTLNAPSGQCLGGFKATIAYVLYSYGTIGGLSFHWVDPDFDSKFISGSWTNCYGHCETDFIPEVLMPSETGAFITKFCSNYGWEIDDLEPSFSNGDSFEFGGHGGGHKCAEDVNVGHCFNKVIIKEDEHGIEAMKLYTTDGVESVFYNSNNPSTAKWTTLEAPFGYCLGGFKATISYILYDYGTIGGMQFYFVKPNPEKFAFVTAHGDNTMSIELSEDKGNTASSTTVENNWWDPVYIPVVPVQQTTVLKFHCENVGGPGGFISSIEIDGETYSTVEPLENGIFKSLNEGMTLSYFPRNVETWYKHGWDKGGIAGDAYWVWNEEMNTEMEFEVRFSDLNPFSQQPTQDTSSPTAKPTPSPNTTAPPTKQPTLVSKEPTMRPSVTPTNVPSEMPSDEPSPMPTGQPTAMPTVEPTGMPTTAPTQEPSVEPTQEPSVEPTQEPSVEPTMEPSLEPTNEPTNVPSLTPVASPTLEPTVNPVETVEVSGDEDGEGVSGATNGKGIKNEEEYEKRRGEIAWIVGLVSVLGLIGIGMGVMYYKKRMKPDMKRDRESKQELVDYVQLL